METPGDLVGGIWRDGDRRVTWEPHCTVDPAGSDLGVWARQWFLIPQAVAPDETFGGLGIAGGFFAGYTGHLLDQRLTHPDLPVEHTTAELTGHALAAGAIIGAIYTTMPSLTSVLGVAIVSHKAPAGYAAARRLADRGGSGVVLLLPATAVGLVALPVGIIGFSPSLAVQGLLFGVAAGLFLHVAVDLLPNCTGTGELCAVTASPEAHDHRFQEPHRSHAALSFLSGGAAVVVVWLLVY